MTAGPTILDCTIRDGSYAIDFKFTAGDTALIAGLLDGAGIPYVEVGHGLGLGASEAGKGTAASGDLEVIERSRARVSAARLGAFFIPGIGREEHLRSARAAGLDFVRIGHNADEMEGAWPFVELARELGLEVFVNFMKTYGVTPESFASDAATAAGLGAAGVYAVDSAGGMMPAEVAAYVRASRAACDLPVGFHGHSNLHLAVANSLAALDAGAQLIDTSVYGIGRSSGNVPTEVMVAVLDRLGIDCGVDALAIIDIAETYVKPVAELLHPHDMVAVALGYGRFHSSHLPAALEAARESGVDPLRLIVELGNRDPMRLPDDLLRETVARLADSRPARARSDIVRFSQAGFGERRIGNRPQVVADLVDGLEVLAAKRRLAVALDLVHSPALDEDAVTGEFVLQDGSMALGRVRFGGLDAAVEALRPRAGRVTLGLLALDRGDPALTGAAGRLLGDLLGGRLCPYRSAELELDYLGDVVLAAWAQEPEAAVALRDPGRYPAGPVERLAARLRGTGRVKRLDPGGAPPPGSLTVVAGPLGSAPEAESVPCRAIYLGGGDGEARPGDVILSREDALRDMLPRFRRAAAALAPREPVR